jgi:hypothetical protein
MIDIHPPHHAATTRRDFFIHLSTVVLGILIAIGLEQSVEYAHHRHQVADLTEQMRAEAQNNLPLIRESIARLKVQAGYVQSLEQALLAGKISGDFAEVQGVLPAGSSAYYVSPSRATWSSAQAAGLAALLTADQAKLYARLDFNTELAIHADSNLHSMTGIMISECVRAHFDHANPAVQRITLAHRDDLLFQLEQVAGAIRGLVGNLSLLEGGDEAILAGARSLQEMYPYQNAARLRNRMTGDRASFFENRGASGS